MGSITIILRETRSAESVLAEAFFVFSIFTIVPLVIYYALLTLSMQLLLLC